jgi:hypothetical protein
MTGSMNLDALDVDGLTKLDEIRVNTTDGELLVY